MTGITAAIANGGRIHTPRLTLSKPVQVFSELHTLGIDADEISLCRKSLANVILKFPYLVDEDMPIAGITGTARIVFRGNPTHAGWFTGYSPVGKPRFVITVMIENAGSGASTSGVVARKIFNALSGDLPPPAPFEPAKGHDIRMEMIE